MDVAVKCYLQLPPDFKKPEKLLDYEEPDNDHEALMEALTLDDRDEYLSLVKNPDCICMLGFNYPYNDVLGIFYCDAVKIATELLKGKYEGIISSASISKTGMTPLHIAAVNHAPKITKYLIERGDNVDALGDTLGDYYVLDLKQATPLDMALRNIYSTHAIQFNSKWRRPWTTRKSIFELLIFVTEMRRHPMEVIRLLIQNTPNKERVQAKFIEFGITGQLVELALMFLAAPELFLLPRPSPNSGPSPVKTLQLFLNSPNKRTDMEEEEGLSILLDALCTVGDKLVAYTRTVVHHDIDEQASNLVFFFREAAEMKLEVYTRDDWILRFFKPVRPEADQVNLDYQVHPTRLPYHAGDRDGEDGWQILKFRMIRKDITIGYINRYIRNLKPVDEVELSRTIEAKLSSMSILRFIFQNIAKISMEREKRLPQWFPFSPRINFQPNVPPFFTSVATSKPGFRFGFKFTPTNNVVNKLMPETKLKSLFSFVSRADSTLNVIKRLIK